jgi:hypothetical protein
MPNIDLLKESRDTDGMVQTFMSALPPSYLYESEELKSFYQGFMDVAKDVLLTLETVTNDRFFLNEKSLLIKEFLVEYGLPNILFPDIQTNQQAVFAISMMKLSSTLVSKEDYENFMALLGFNVTFYNLNVATIGNSTFNYNFPISFSASLSKKDKLTYWIYVEEDEDSSNLEYNNIGDAFNIDFVASQNKLLEASKILDFLKPDYLKFQYITLYTKQLYGL